MSRFLYRLGTLAVRRRRRVLIAWIVLAIVLVGGGRSVGGRFSNEFRLPGSESQVALDLLRKNFPVAAGADGVIVFHSRTGDLHSPEAAAVVGTTLAQIRSQPHVFGVDDPLGDQAATNLSPDGTIAFARVRYDVRLSQLGASAFSRLKEAAVPARQAGLEAELGGVVASGDPETGPAESVGLAAAVLILFLAFGSLVAMGLSIGPAVVSIAVGLTLVGLAARFFEVPTVASILATMIGLGVGIDYALFVVTRYRQHLQEGMAVGEAVGRANATAGQAVLFAGGTVVIAITGLWLSGIPLVGTMGLAAALVVAVSVVAAVTLLPALLGFAGTSVNRLRLGLRPRNEVAGAGSNWSRWGRHVGRHSWAYLLASFGLLLALAVPLFSMRLGQIDAGSSPPSSTQRRAYDLLARGFGPGFNGPLLVVAQLSSPSDRDAIARVATAIAADPGVVAVSPAAPSPSGETLVLRAIPGSAPSQAETSTLVHRLRDQVIPRAVAGSGAKVYLTGPTAGFIDVSERVAGRLPVFIGAVVLLSFLLLMVVFRSILVPLKAAVLNLLSIGAAYGVIVAVFQWGWGKGLVGLEEPVPIVSFVPMIMFAVLFGLSMDYEVFLLSRVREEHVRTGDNLGSVVAGLASTGRVITSAALIMISVFGSFALKTDPIVKMFGVGLATAVLVDATIVRVALVPATMGLLGEANWWLPRWLDKLLPRIDIDGEGTRSEDLAA